MQHHRLTHAFVFRRDLRLEDNLGLLGLCARLRGGSRDDAVLLLFFVDERQVDPAKNAYRSPWAARFLADCVEDLSRATRGKLCIVRCRGDTDGLDAVRASCPGGGLKSVSFNADCTPFARARDAAIREWCEERGVECHAETREYHLFDPRAQPKPYQVFTPYLRFCTNHGATATVTPVTGGVPPGLLARCVSGSSGSRGSSVISGQVAIPEFRRIMCGTDECGVRNEEEAKGRQKKKRALALGILRAVEGGAFGDYDKTRDDLALAQGVGTTALSAHIKFGTVSVREVLRSARKAKARGGAGNDPLVRQLYWRNFYEQVAWFFPHVLRGQGVGTNKGVKGVKGVAAGKWTTTSAGTMTKKKAATWAAWCEGRTGFPLVDAGMRELLQTGRMHNRTRMLTACFLVKDLGIDWREGERWFASHLVDYDPCANSGGWQWVAGCGADAMPPWRVFSPWRQAERFDPRAEYVLRWVPELRAVVPASDLLKWEDPEIRRAHRDSINAITGSRYPCDPILDHSVVAKQYIGRIAGLQKKKIDQ